MAPSSPAFDGYAVGLGMFSADAAERAQDLRNGLPLAASASGGQPIDKEIDQLIRRLASRGLVEYRLVRAQTDADAIVIEPQMADYWPKMAPLDDTDTLVLSRFAYMRRRGNDMVLESPRAGALFRICDPKLAAAVASLSTPQQIQQLQGQDGFPGGEFFALLVDCEILFKVGAPATAACGPPRAMPILCCGIFTICCSTPAARRGGTPTRQVAFMPMRQPCRRCRR